MQHQDLKKIDNASTKAFISSTLWDFVYEIRSTVRKLNKFVFLQYYESKITIRHKQQKNVYKSNAYFTNKSSGVRRNLPRRRPRLLRGKPTGFFANFSYKFIEIVSPEEALRHKAFTRALACEQYITSSNCLVNTV